MNNKEIDIRDLPEFPLPVLSDYEAGEMGKKWSFINIYSLQVLRDIFILVCGLKEKNVRNLTNKMNSLMEPNTELTERQVLENLNALVKIELLDSDYNPKIPAFLGSSIGSDLNHRDKNVFRRIFYEYFRFRELSAWFLINGSEVVDFQDVKALTLLKNSHPLYFFSERSRFTDTLLTHLKKPEYKYIIQNEVVSRFWDVFLSWGCKLDILEKFSVTKFSQLRGVSEISIVYFIRKFQPFDLNKFIKDNFKARKIWIPELIFQIAKIFRFSVEEIKWFVVQNILENNNFTFERTSEIFLIKGKTSKKNIQRATYLYPQMDGYYISNIIIRK